MNDSGQNGDELAQDGVFSVALPASLQQHRWLIRYRTSAIDETNAAVTVPYPDDPQPNFAFFCDGQENERSFGRYREATTFWVTMLPSSNALNTAPMPQLVISEVMYHPPNIGTNDNARYEFVELYNASAVPLTFQDTNGVWRLSGGAGFTFPAGFTLPAAGVMLLVNFDVSDSAALQSFWSWHGVTNTSIPILGPFLVSFQTVVIVWVWKSLSIQMFLVIPIRGLLSTM
jgi:hypothetical protein